MAVHGLLWAALGPRHAGAVLFRALADTSAAVAATASRSTKIDLLAGLLRGAPAPLAAVAVAYLMGELPQGKLGVGYAALRAVRALPSAEAASLGVVDVDAACSALAAVSGAGANKRRVALLEALFARMTAPEAEFFARLVSGELRQGALDGVMADAVANAAGIPAEAVRRAAMFAGRLTDVAAALFGEGPEALARFALQLFVPVQPMLAQTAEGLAEVLVELGEVALEWKLDGARVQVHRDGARVQVFTRQLHDVTAAVPEVVEAALALPCARCVLDGEAIARHPDGRPRPFQDTMRRFGRRLDVGALRLELPLACRFFDLLLDDSGETVVLPLRERSARLHALAPDARVPQLRTSDLAAAEAFVAQALAVGHEGVMIKDLAAPYEAGRRGAGWRKLKPVRTLDLVVLAAEWGSGRREGWLSNIHLGARDPAGGFVMVGKTFKGMTDVMLAAQTRDFLALETSREPGVVHLRPERVVEIAFDGVQRSPRYPGGVALRFARVVRYRLDKAAGEADEIGQLRAMLP